MKKISSLVQTKTGLLALAISMALIGGTVVLGVQFVNNQIQVAQEKQRRELVQQLDNLIADAKAKYFTVGISVDVYKDLGYRHEGFLNLVQLSQLGGQPSQQQKVAQQAANVKQLLKEAQQKVEQTIVETQTAQQALQKFVTTHQDLMQTVSPQMRADVDSILEKDIRREVQIQIAQRPSFFPF